jgi:hypothetical protein
MMQLIGESNLSAFEDNSRLWSRWPDMPAVLEGAAHVGVHVALSGAGRRHRGRGRFIAWFDQHDAWRFTKPLAETDAAAGASSVRCNHCDYGHDLGDGSLKTGFCHRNATGVEMEIITTPEVAS